MQIEFRLQQHLQGVVPEPYKAGEKLPKWFKNLIPDTDTGSEFPIGTAKRCMPMLDALGAGYIIPLPVAVSAKANENDVNLSWRTGDVFVPVGQHSPAQVGESEWSNKGVFKWVNPWQIITPEGYSCLFITPVNQPDLPFKCFTGIVDTDSYHNMINFPFLWTKFPYDKILDQGEPIIQVIPFKRQQWKHKITYLDEQQSKEIDRGVQKVYAKNHKYKSEDHHKKQW